MKIYYFKLFNPSIKYDEISSSTMIATGSLTYDKNYTDSITITSKGIRLIQYMYDHNNILSRYIYYIKFIEIYNISEISKVKYINVDNQVEVCMFYFKTDKMEHIITHLGSEEILKIHHRILKKYNKVCIKRDKLFNMILK